MSPAREVLPKSVTRMSSFQIEALDRITSLLKTEGIAELSSSLHGESPAWVGIVFLHNDKEHRVEIYPDFVVMHQEEHYYEPHLADEFKTGDALLHGFLARLTRYLTEGRWGGAREGVPFDSLKRFFSKIIARKSGLP